jgi:hypothetical protein
MEDGTLNAYVIEPSEIQEGDRFGYKVIAFPFVGWNGWGAYRGPTTWSDERVAESGDAVSQHIAELLFPALRDTGRVYSP